MELLFKQGPIQIRLCSTKCPVLKGLLINAVRLFIFHRFDYSERVFRKFLALIQIFTVSGLTSQKSMVSDFLLCMSK